jgi:glycosyltransferase involved in cell wall biosynthesis
MPSQLRIAYITTHYPALSHTFILREVAVLRRLGAEIHTISLRRTSGEHLLSPQNREAWRTTHAVVPPRWRAILSVHLAALARHPRAYLSTLREGLCLGRPGLRGRLWQVFYFGEAIAVWHHCRALDACHLHAHHGSAPADVALLSARFGEAAGTGPRTWSFTLHGPIELQDVRWFALAEKVRRAQAVVCISDFARSQLMGLVERRYWRKLQVIHCGVNARDYEHVRRPSGGRARILNVGRLVAEKGHAVLLQAIAQLAHEGYDPELALVGSGPMQAELERLACELGVVQRVSFRGALAHDEIASCYAGASVFCCASFAEGVPVVLMEAMASGCPVVATAIAGVRELVQDGRTGLLVAPGRADELAHAIATLLDSPELSSRLSLEAGAWVRREFDIDRSAAQLGELFGEVLQLSEPRSPMAAVRDTRDVARVA